MSDWWKFDQFEMPDISHLHEGDRNRIQAGQYDTRESELLHTGQNPWTKSGKPEPLKPKDKKPEQGDLPLSTGTRVVGQVADDKTTPQEERNRKLRAFMPEQVRAAYDAADFEQKQIIWAANERAFEDAEIRKEQRLRAEQKLMEKIFDKIQRIKEDPSKAHLQAPANASMQELRKWFKDLPGTPGIDAGAGSRQVYPNLTESQITQRQELKLGDALHPMGDEARGPVQKTIAVTTFASQTEEDAIRSPAMAEFFDTVRRYRSAGKDLFAYCWEWDHFAYIAGGFLVAGGVALAMSAFVMAEILLGIGIGLFIVKGIHDLWANKHRKEVAVILCIFGVLAIAGEVVLIEWNRPRETKADELTRLVKGLGEKYTREELLKKFPLGYVVFDVQYTNSVFPYDQKLPTGFQLDWTEVGFIAITKDSYQLRLPSVLKNGHVLLGNVIVSGPKRVDGLGNGYTVDDTLVVAEILSITDKGMVFVVGFKQVPGISS